LEDKLNGNKSILKQIDSQGGKFLQKFIPPMMITILFSSFILSLLVFSVVLEVLKPTNSFWEGFLFNWQFKLL
jgi:hypothetical protein